MLLSNYCHIFLLCISHYLPFMEIGFLDKGIQNVSLSILMSGLYIKAVSSPSYIVSNDRMINNELE